MSRIVKRFLDFNHPDDFLFIVLFDGIIYIFLYILLYTVFQKKKVMHIISELWTCSILGYCSYFNESLI